MADRESVIKGLECCKMADCKQECPYKDNATGDCIERLCADALELLKGKQPTWRRGKAFCGNCGGCLENKEKYSSDHVKSIRFCKWCGSPVDWTNEQKP